MTLQTNEQNKSTETKAMESKPAKLFFIICVLALIIYIFIISSQFVEQHATALSHNKSMKYIMIWTLPDTSPFKYLGKGQNSFIKRKCSERNCYVTSDTNKLADFRDFDAVAFHGPEISQYNVRAPPMRSPRQIYIYASKESSHNYPICDQELDHFFNWTWTYRLDSDLLFGYFVVKDKGGHIVGPNDVMHWIPEKKMMPIGSYIRAKLATKYKAAAWLVSSCKSYSKRETFVDLLETQMAFHGLVLDIFGKCGPYRCGDKRQLLPDCWETIQNDYFFYLSFENSFSRDYVTEKLLNPLKHYTVPIVYGAANYTRFVPNGAYLNAVELGTIKLAQEMKRIIEDKESYYSFFKWRNHYSYHDIAEDPATDNYCRLCEALHSVDTRDRTGEIPFTEWWNVPDKCIKDNDLS